MPLAFSVVPLAYEGLRKRIRRTGGRAEAAPTEVPVSDQTHTGAPESADA